ncbi:hypothetical protein ColTof4_07228 [Colletotrichum tofieldiae]|nr:hypothetical protein ColTof3_12169 [Colletotrichum tofieldiae]GKT74805.1 hypothetical protein ColTof4_07228 [Colletotrichum tofieldiae]
MQIQLTGRGPDSEFRRDLAQKAGKLWSPDADPLIASRHQEPIQHERETTKEPGTEAPSRTSEQRPYESDATDTMIQQPELWPISHNPSIAEVKEGYAYLDMMGSQFSGDNPARPIWDFETRSSTPKQQTGPLVARGHINGREVNALADTGAGYNIVPVIFAKRLGWDPLSHKHGNGEKLRMANGNFIDTIGAFKAVWKFASEPSKRWKITFHVVRNLVHDAVLGKDFLMGSETMTKNRHRLSRLKSVFRTFKGLPMLFVNDIGAVTQRLQGLINGDRVYALPDSGSEPNLLSLDYIVRRGMHDLVDMNDIRMIQFADGTIQKTMGSLRVNWVYTGSSADNDKWSEHFVEFHVLRGCVYDAIIGQDVLEDTDAFITHEGSFMDVYIESEPSGLNLVSWVPKDHYGQGPPSREGISFRDRLRILRQHCSFSPASATNPVAATPSPVPEHSSERQSKLSSRTSVDMKLLTQEELERRVEAERKYRRMPRGPEREAEIAKEEENRRQYDMSRFLTPVSDSSSRSGGGLVIGSSAVGAKFVGGRGESDCAAPTRGSLRRKLGRLRGIFPGGSRIQALQVGSTGIPDGV